MIKLFFVLFVILFVIIYFIPSFVAIGRKHAHVLQITILNAFLGWMFPIWVVALVWSTTQNTDEFIETKGAWITIIAFLLIMLSPMALYGFIPKNYKTQSQNEFHYKKVIYTTDVDMNNGKVVRKIIEFNNK